MSTGMIQVLCCEKFREAHRQRKIEIAHDNTIHVNGCCGGGCYVLTYLKFCPFCGAKLHYVPTENIKPTG